MEQGKIVHVERVLERDGSQATYSGNKGIMYKNKLELDNGDVGICLNMTPDKWKVGDVITYEHELNKYGNNIKNAKRFEGFKSSVGGSFNDPTANLEQARAMSIDNIILLLETVGVGLSSIESLKTASTAFFQFITEGENDKFSFIHRYHLLNSGIKLLKQDGIVEECSTSESKIAAAIAIARSLHERIIKQSTTGSQGAI